MTSQVPSRVLCSAKVWRDEQFRVQINMVYCTAFNCNNDGKKMKHLSFFQFPSDEKYRQIWKEKVRRLNWEPNKYSRLCSAHFESHCFLHNYKLFDSLGLPRPKKATLKHDAIPTIFDYEDRTSKPATEQIISRKRKHEETNSHVPWKGRKILEVIDFNSLLDDYLKGVQSEEELWQSSTNSPTIKIESDELVDEIIPGSSPCEGGDKFVLILNKPLPANIDIKSAIFCVRFGSGHVVPATLWKEQMIRGEYIPRSDKPGVVVAQLETNDGKVLGSTKFVYKEEISTGFRKLVCSKNYGGKLVKALSNIGVKKNPALNHQTKTEADAAPLPPPESSLALTSILKLMLYIAAKHEAGEFFQDLFRTKVGKAVINSFKDEEKKNEDDTQSTLQQRLNSYLQNMSERLTADEKERKAMMALPKPVKVEEKKQPKPIKKPVLKKKLKRKEVKTKPKKPVKAKMTSTKKPISGNTVGTECSDVSTSKTNSLLMLSNIALRELNFHSNENGFTDDFSLNTPENSLLSVKKEKKSTYQSQNAKKFTRKMLLLPPSSTCLPTQGELLKIKTSSEVNRGLMHLENDMTAADVLQEVRSVLNTLGKKRIRLAAADSSGTLEFFKGTKWTGKTLRQRIRYNSVLYVVPSS
ncbi:hypothetical protein ACROYT_G044275 [Oculina patagonica]